MASSDDAVATATASSSVPTGTYTINVSQIAQSHQVSTDGFASETAAIGTGTVSLQVGSGERADISIDTSNSSLQGLRDAINAADVGATAQIIDDGSGDNAFRLVLSADDTGADNTINLDTTGLSGTGADGLQRVSEPSGFTSGGGTVSLSGLYEGSDLPEILVRVADVSGGTTGETVGYEMSIDGGDTYAAVTNVSGGVIDLKAELGLDSSAPALDLSVGGGTLAVNDEFTVRPLQQLAAAQNANLSFGSGGSTFEITRPSNAMDDVVAGMNINLGTSTGTAVFTVSNNADTALESVQTFIENFNSAAEYLYENTSYNSETEEAGILQSETGLIGGLNDMIAGFTGEVPGTSLSVASAVGIRLNDSGLLELDESAFSEALQADADKVRQLFANTGDSSNTGIQFVTMTGDTDVDTTHTIEITTAAARASVSGTVDLSAGVTISAGNDLLELDVNGKRINLDLADGSYADGDAIVAHLQSLLDAESNLENDAVTVDLDDNNQLRFTGQRFGSSQDITVLSGTALADLGLVAGVRGEGIDVAGTIDGLMATGSGQALTGASGSGDGLTVLVTLSAEQVSAGNDSATLDVSKGLAQRVDESIQRLTDAANGLIPGIETRFSTDVERLDERIADIDARLDIRRQRLLGDFRNMEQLLAGFQTQQSFLTGQIQAFQNLAASSAGNS